MQRSARLVLLTARVHSNRRVCNLVARLCAEAKDGQILVALRVAVAVEETMPLEEVDELTLKGLTQLAFNVPLAAIRPALRVIDGRPQRV
jgi:hypothetical protein